LVIMEIQGWTPMELVVPVEPVELEPDAAEAAPPHVEVEAAPEGGGGGTAEMAHLPLAEARAWFESVRAGGRFHRPEK
jgi:hypothetical protein